MVWDGLIVVIVLTLAVAGWNVGIVNSWRGPLAIILATFITQQFYVDFSTWIVQQLRVTPDQAVAMGYFLLWCALEIVSELLFSVMLPFNKKTRPMFFERLSGATLGIVKGLVVILLPLIALTGPIKVPKAPADKSALVNPVESGIDKSALLGIFGNFAHDISPIFAPLVISYKDPSFKPSFSGTSSLDEDNKVKP